MLQDEYARLAKSVGYVSERQARDIISIVLEKVKRDCKAGIVEVWIREHGHGNVDVLRSYIRLKDENIPASQVIALTNDATGLLVWIAEKRRPVWLNDIRRGATSGRNLHDDELIEGRYFNLFDRTRAFAAVPIEYRDQLRAILTAEVIDDDVSRIEKENVNLLNEISEATAIMIWKASVFVENERQADEAISFLRSSDTKREQSFASHRTGFIARPFHGDFDPVCDEIEEFFRKQHIQGATYQPSAGEPYVVQEMHDQINSAHFGIADITGLNHNVLLEAGMMINTNKPLLIIRRKDDNTPVPFDISGRQYYRYTRRDGQTYIFDGRKEMSIEEFIGKFVESLLLDKNFREAREWYGS